MTKLATYRPLNRLSSLQRNLDRLFEDVFPIEFGEGIGETPGDLMSTVWAPRMDVTEADGEYMVTMDIPGVAKDDVTITLNEGRLTVSGKREGEEKKEGKNYVRLEREYGSFFRSIMLPQSIKEDNVNATFKDGVLIVHVPKAQEKKPKRITIK